MPNSWIIINVGGRPTDDKPAVSLEAPRDPDRVSSFLDIRVKDIQTAYAEWSARGAQFLTPPKQHQYEIRGYICDPDRQRVGAGAYDHALGESLHLVRDPAGNLVNLFTPVTEDAIKRFLEPTAGAQAAAG